MTDSCLDERHSHKIAIEARETFIDAGGENFTTIPCLNSSPESIKLLAQLAHVELAGWVA